MDYMVNSRNDIEIYSLRAYRPWNSPDAVAHVRLRFAQTPQTEIEKCINCTLPRCRNCLDPRNSKR